MYQPISLELINFGSHKQTTFNFKEHETVLLTGINESDDGQKSNGSGKSFIIEGLSFALLGSSLRKVKDKELVQEGEKESTVNLVLHNPISKHTLNITRRIYANTKSGELVIEGEDNITSVNEGNQFILDTLGLTRDDVLNYFLLSKERYTSFFNSSDTSKKELINRFSKADRIQTSIESCESDIGQYQEEVNSYQSKIDANDTLIDALSDSSSSSNDSLIESLEKENETLKSTLIELDLSIDDKILLLSTLQEEVDSAKAIVQSHEPSIEEINKNLREYEVLKDEIDKHLRNEVKCPSCDHKFSLKDDAFSLEEAKSMYPMIEESIKDYLMDRKLKKDKLSIAETSFKTAQNEYRETEFQVKRLGQDKKMHSRMIENNNKQIEKFQKPPENFQGRINKLKLENEKFASLLQTSQNNLSQSKEWFLRFKRFKGWIASKSLKSIEGQANFYLQKLGSSLSIELSGYTPIKGGKEIREKIYTTVLRGGKEAPFSRFSGGERARIEVAIILAMQRIINQSTIEKGLDLLVLDEILESLDSKGLELLLKSLNNLGLNVLIISHATMDMNYQNTLTVKKINGISEIISQHS